MALTRVWIPTSHYSSRQGSKVRLAVVHTTEGANSFRALGSYFATTDKDVSSHTGIDDTAGTIGEFVRRADKAWTCADANPYSVNAELCAWASWSRAQWLTHPVMLATTKAWLQEECAFFGIPFVRLNALQAQDGHSAGICGHVDLGPKGGSHWDPGPGFPWDVVLSGGPSPAPTPSGRGNMLITQDNGDGWWLLDENGGVFAKGGAPFKGSLPGVPAKPNSPIIGGASSESGQGYVLVDTLGEVYAFGDAQYLGPDPTWRQEWGIGTPDNPVIGIASCHVSGQRSYVLGTKRAGSDPTDYAMEPDGRYAQRKP